jgi:predicted NUDIX family phosphoesterase
MTNENVFGLPRDCAGELPNGFFSLPDTFLESLGSKGTFMERALAEKDTSFKQIIPYVIIEHQGRILSYQRTKQGGESRLHLKHSIGFGGHINDTDHQPQSNILYTGMLRELNEEVFLPTLIGLQLLGGINDDSTPVGQVHLGVVFRAQLATANCIINEPDQLVATWRTPAELLTLKPEMETWSQYALGCL